MYDMHTFAGKEDYLKLLPSDLPQKFTINDIALSTQFSKTPKNQVYKMMWTFEKMGLVECIGKQGRCKLFKI